MDYMDRTQKGDTMQPTQRVLRQSFDKLDLEFGFVNATHAACAEAKCSISAQQKSPPPMQPTQRVLRQREVNGTQRGLLADATHVACAEAKLQSKSNGADVTRRNPRSVC